MTARPRLLLPRFLETYRTTGRHALRFERGLAVGRAFLAVSGLVAIFIDPTEPVRFATLVYTLLATYAAYSVALLLAMRRSVQWPPGASLTLHGIDLAWVAALTFFSEGPVSPFFLFFLFVLLAAAYRWGFRETIATAAISITVYLLETAVAVVGPWSRTWFAEVGFDWTPVLLRTTYLLITGILLAYLAEREKQFRAEMAATADAMRQPRVEIGADGSVHALARLLARMFDAAAVDVVIQDREDGRTLLWHAPRPGRDGAPTPVRSMELDEHHRGAWFFPLPRVPCLVERAPGDEAFVAALPGADGSGTKRTNIQLPALVRDSQEFQSFLAADFGLPGQWHGRVLLFDADATASAGERLAFLESLTEQLTPVLSNVLLIQRQRARASAEARARVARDLHDGAIQTLIGIELEATALGRRAEAVAPDLVPDLRRIQDLLRREVIALRELMLELRPVEIGAPDALPEVLGAFVDRFRRDSGIAARFACETSTRGLPAGTAVEVVRIVQEALVNVRRHSGARQVTVTLSARDGRWTLSVDDDGRGFEFDGRLEGRELDAWPARPVVICERARSIGGTVAVESSPGRGAKIEVLFSAQ